ncbi:MAG: ribosomal RNA small subunit methyltransferase A [Candidatus Yanofskybacteria bacterium RIFCSPLOWO2_02_FULL_43_10]|uniref:Ribosomal RNA small subunit methyltransferase A n=1 Tax=Candidatus Yanofskybacteria bacterium RIFCSPLOWO2_12_FULL_43_11b TaxID=1802710 RepID=A0A1F8HAM9_9BACT|nr:MAG: ribosomal RNA small subunit methyltransferase A [Candidatus Yanofskybacteria bacterium RIFCSPHIGHO2_01_FULL_43_32]OGN10795.1 MAG: ribosomal RNA small subunit methyltransferase A [Candidatus Yanofskybacteria bacterium RIFCSPHIGHO2_02_FULL_43_12]OGN17994.1 MAG: ribosomal RNA small subunit methyltransferase A [Candidatus Yanofskybacteria bacterium RIFCSPHIGHO2_12_FULL_43_11]OGN25015.1 MAG: ribosomal RNA small subunit methyltransferase A [Candidatus Yanofskybacteria bacterium RIFCSPLOWO2_01_
MKLFPKKSLGQNFLINQGILDKIIQAVEVEPEDIIIEVGPGTGNLTEKLAKKADQVIAIEKDRRLIELLKEKFKDSNIEIVEGDALEVDIGNLLLSSISLAYGRKVNYKVVGNIPYYITSNLLRTIFEKWPKPKLIVLTVQKEVAKRIVAKPPDMNLLALSVQFYSSPEIIGYVSKGSFRPMPKVDSAIIKLTPHATQHAIEETERFFKLIKAGFSGKRKQLINNLVKNFGIMRENLLKIFEKTGLEPDIRAENLSLNQWIELSKFMEK